MFEAFFFLFQDPVGVPVAPPGSSLVLSINSHDKRKANMRVFTPFKLKRLIVKGSKW